MLHLIETRGLPIVEQLRLEEALLRVGRENYCLINWQAPHAIVLGISAVPSQMVEEEKWRLAPIPLVRRFSGGGTVLIEPGTVLISWIVNHTFTKVPPYPREVMQWTLPLWQKLLPALPLSLRENDYVIGDRKWGGNAQYFTKDRCVHHTSLIWDYTPDLMDYLKLPSKRPEYRGKRSHHDFIAPLNPTYPCQETFVSLVKANLASLFPLERKAPEYFKPLLEIPHRKATHLLEGL